MSPGASAAKLEPHQATQIVLMDGQLRPGQRTAPEPDAADRACGVAVFRFEAEHPALGVGPAATKRQLSSGAPARLECRLRQLLFSVAQERRITGDTPAKGSAEPILDMTHEEAFLIVLRQDKAPHGTLLGINRTAPLFSSSSSRSPMMSTL